MEETDAIKNKAQEFNDKLKELSQKLELSDKQQIIGIDAKDNIKLGGNLERNNIFVVKIKEENGDIFHIVIDSDMNPIASINKDGKIELSEREAKLWESFIGKKDLQTAEQKKIYDFEQEYYLEEYKMDKSLQENNYEQRRDSAKTRQNINGKDVEQQKNSEEQKAAEGLNVDETAIICMIKIEDRETFGQAINKKLDADAYIVRYGNNKTKIMQEASKGKLVELSGVESNEFNSEVMEQLNLDKPRENQRIKAGDLTTIRTEDHSYNYVVVRENDSKNGIVIVNSSTQTKMYAFDDEGKESLKEIETSIKYRVGDDGTGDDENISGKEKAKKTEEQDEEEKEQDDEDEGRTPWGDAYARSRR